MAKNPIETMLDEVVWTPLPEPDGTSDLPYATHEGVLDIAGTKLRVYQLSDGVRVIDSDDVARFIGGPSGK